ncbi:MAG: hypothetical protein IT425_11565 [Pirellulales bacterium]|nr:hypothetical protein [Pirellulales bacterium]
MSAILGDMKPRLFLITAVAILSAMGAGVAGAAPLVELEIATDRGLQITAPQQWLQLLAGIGIHQVRLRGIEPGDQPRIETNGTGQKASFSVLGILGTDEVLRLPGGTFKRSDRARLKEYFDQLAADGVDSLTAPRGRYGLTEKELSSVFDDLSPPVSFNTKGLSPRTALDRLQAQFAHKLVLTRAAESTLRGEHPPVADELNGLSRGTALAMLLRSYELAMRPEKPRGGAIEYRVEPLDGLPEAIRKNTLGKTNGTDIEMKHWPIGWEPDRAPGAVAPSLMESLSAEIDGYSLEEALAAIGPRLKVPAYLDHAALSAFKIEPTKIPITLPKARMSYKRLLDRVLAQARLGSSVRIDESGRPFLWVSR